MKDFNAKNFAALIGIDWADKKHDICELPMDHSGFSFTVISSRPESIHDWAMSRFVNVIQTNLSPLLANLRKVR